MPDLSKPSREAKPGKRKNKPGAGRPKIMTSAVKVGVMVESTMLDRIDAERGKRTRSEYVRMVLLTLFASLDGEEIVQVPRNAVV